MQDFTLTTYKKPLQELLSSGYSFQTLQDYIHQPGDKTVILRHYVDRKPGNAFVIAKIEKEAGIKASYYFRIVKESYDEDVIRQIAEMGHEIGYHYENLAEVSKKNPQINADLRISHRHTQTFSRATCSDKNGHRFAKRQRSGKDRGRRAEGQEQETEIRTIEEYALLSQVNFTGQGLRRLTQII